MTDSLRLNRVSKRYGPALALDDASLLVRPGTIHAVLGENGAGKTTMLRVAFGMASPDSGTLERNGEPVRFRSAADAIASGIGMVHQHFTLVPAMTVAENLSLGGAGPLSAAAAAEHVRDISRRTGFDLDPCALVEALPVVAQQRLEIAKALARDASLLVMDEPTAVLAPAEAEELLAWLRRFVDGGRAVILVTHKLREALAVADDVTVLRHGRVVLSAARADVTERSLGAAMLGANPEQAVVVALTGTAVAAAGGESLFMLDHAELRDEGGTVRVRDATVRIGAGELVGIAAVEGSGHRELLRALAGRLEPSRGRVTRPARVGFIPEDRHRDAILLDRSLVENVALRGSGDRRGRIRWRTLRSSAQEMIRAFDVRGGRPELAVRALSGGNQQKLVLARELAGVDAVVAESPTRGLDVHATADVHHRLRECAAAGITVVVYSSDLDEVLSLASRMLVVHAGTVREAPLDRERVGRAMLGAD